MDHVKDGAKYWRFTRQASRYIYRTRDKISTQLLVNVKPERIRLSEYICLPLNAKRKTLGLCIQSNAVIFVDPE